MNQPTKEQEQWLWEQCGFTQETDNRKGYHWERGFRYHDWLTPNGETSYDFSQKGQLPSIDLNNLFKYPVSRFKNAYTSFEREGNVVYCYGKYDEGEYPCGCPAELRLEGSIEINDMDYDKACALALFWAIFSALKNT